MTKSTPEQIELLEQKIRFTEKGFDIVGDLPGNVKGNVWRNVGGDVGFNVEGSVGFSVFGDVGGDVGDQPDCEHGHRNAWADYQWIEEDAD